MVLFDAISLVLVLLGSFSISTGFLFWPPDELFWIIFGAPVIAIPVFFSFRLYQSVVRYIGFKALWSIFQAVTLYAVIWGLLSLMSNHPLMMNLLGSTINPFAINESYFEGISRSVILINWMLTLIIIGGSIPVGEGSLSTPTIYRTPIRYNLLLLLVIPSKNSSLNFLTPNSLSK